MREIRVAQVIDSLNPGGAEMVAVNLANELAKMEGFVSYLIVSRKAGILEKRVHPNICCVILHKKSSKDLQAVWRLYRLLSKQKIDIVHAHSSSFYLPAFLKKFCRFKLVWHDHYGKKVDTVAGARDYPVKPFVRFFDFVFAVNKQLLATDMQFFKIPESKICYLPNFSVSEEPAGETLVLKGKKESRIVCLANLRPQKDHLNLLEAFRKVLAARPETYLYLLGGGNKDEYERVVLNYISENGLNEKVIWLGSQTYPAKILQQCSIGVLSSESEGLPLAIIEYGLTSLPVVSTAVGEVPAMLSDGEHALLVPPKNPHALANAMLAILDKRSHTLGLSANLEKLINNQYSSKAVMTQVIDRYKNILTK